MVFDETVELFEDGFLDKVIFFVKIISCNLVASEIEQNGRRWQMWRPNQADPLCLYWLATQTFSQSSRLIEVYALEIT